MRFLRQSTLREVKARFRSLFDEGLIGREVFTDLERGVLDTGATHERPRFDIGLNTRQLIQRLDILAGLDEGQLERLSRMLRPLLAVPNDQIVRMGEQGDAVYFIASGAVEVIRPERRISLGSGAVFWRNGSPHGSAPAG